MKIWLAAERDPVAVGIGDGCGSNVSVVRIVAMAAHVCKCWKLRRKRLRKRRRNRERGGEVIKGPFYFWFAVEMKMQGREGDRVVVVIMHVRRSTHVYVVSV